MIQDIVQAASIDRVRSALGQHDIDYPLEEVVRLCPELTWNQVFLAIVHLSQEGWVRVTMDASGTTIVRMCQWD